MVLPLLSPQLMTWYRVAFNMRAHGTAKATIQTFLNTKLLASADVTAILATIAA